MKKKLMLIDGNSILNRAFYGLKGNNLLSTSDGIYTNAVYGFINIMNKYLEEEKPDLICVAFDLKEKTMRHIEYQNYKANRKKMPDELAMQVPIIKEVLDTMNIKRIEMPGFEADDIIGTLSLNAEEDNLNVVILTGDRDALQLASNKTKIKIPKTKAGKTETEDYDYQKIIDTYALTPDKLIDVKALAGDASDNIPGVKGIGEKTALTLIQKYQGLEELYKNIENIDKKSVKEKLEKEKEMAFLSKKLVTIIRNIPNIWDYESCLYREYNAPKMLELFKKLEFKSLIQKYNLESNVKKLNAPIETVDLLMINNKELLNNLHNEITAKKTLSMYVYIEDSILYGISFFLDKAYYIAINNIITEEIFLNKFKDIFENSTIKKYGHDTKPFILYLKQKGISLEGLSFDTIIASYIINPSLSDFSLKNTVSIFLEQEIESIQEIIGKGKNYKCFNEIQEEKLASIAALYAKKIIELKDTLDKKLNENNQQELFKNIELPLIFVLADMEFWGFKVNKNELIQFGTELENKISILAKEINFLAECEFNINSPKQLGNILFDKLKLPVIKKTKTGYSTDAEVLEQLASKHEIVSKILEYRQIMKLKSTYVEGLLNIINPKTSKIHSSFNQTATVTGRISSTEPNLQNIPIKLELGRKIRKVFIPENENFLLLDADYSQIELRVLAHITKDQNMLSAFINNEDIHTTTASKVFNIPKNEVSSLLRSRAKAVNFGIVYGIGEFSLSKDIGVSRKEAKKYIDDYLEKYPNIKKYMVDIVKSGKDNGFVTTLFNRKRYLPELKSSNFTIRSFGERVAMNTPIQGTAADIIKIAMVNVYAELKAQKLKSRLILQVHDELLIEVHKDELSIVEKILKTGMENAVKLEIPLTVEIKSGQNWYETK